VIPPHRPNLRQAWPSQYFVDATAKWAAIVAQIAQVHAEGRPVLVGTRSVAASEHLGRLLKARNFLFALLNAVRNKEEAAIISLAGEPRQITIATNMAGRRHGYPSRRRCRQGRRPARHPHRVPRVGPHRPPVAGPRRPPRRSRLDLHLASIEDELVERFLPGFASRTVAAMLRAHSLRAHQVAGWMFRFASAAPRISLSASAAP